MKTITPHAPPPIAPLTRKTGCGWPLLAPGARACDIAGAPVKATLLDEQLVIRIVLKARW